ncbi:MAG: 4-(cytidine 5'-diphospho)-2-C-methyl-D-erythritol kinase [Dehalococcoidia bacterium]|nr:4-(cytidine 5'-diphospho)-2-C-methyl-D-erythritol kinase [Dehalococcoidia bacterium]
MRRAYAKINLTFEVLGRRPDGYHEVVSVMQAISLHDVLTFEPHDRIQLAADIAELVSPGNLVYRAVRLMQGLASAHCGIAVSLSKGIPLASGLGGGSSDAATTLLTLNRLWGLRLSKKRLLELGARLGSDVPFFVQGSPTALVTGRGDKVKALPSPSRTWVVLVRPPIELPDKTRKMYGHLDPACFTRGQHAARLTDSIRGGTDLADLRCYNAFETVACSVFAGLDHYKRAFLAGGAATVHLAGAGPALFTLVDNRDKGETILRRLRATGLEAYLAETL